MAHIDAVPEAELLEHLKFRYTRFPHQGHSTLRYHGKGVESIDYLSFSLPGVEGLRACCLRSATLASQFLNPQQPRVLPGFWPYWN